MTSSAAPKLRVQVVYALPERHWVIDVELPAGSTIRNAIERSRIVDECAELDLSRVAVGVFGQRRQPGELVKAGDRVEIYRPLTCDPKEMRRRRAREDD